MRLKSVSEIMGILEKQGWRFERTRNGHHMAYNPDGVRKCLLSEHHSERDKNRNVRNMVAQLRRAGADIPH